MTSVLPSSFTDSLPQARSVVTPDLRTPAQFDAMRRALEKRPQPTTCEPIPKAAKREGPKTPPRRKAVKRKPTELVEAERIVRARSGGRCEAQTPWCEGAVTQVHQTAGRVGMVEVVAGVKVSCHDPVVLLDVCGAGNISGCHGFIHSHPEISYRNGWLRRRNGRVRP